MTAMEEAVNRIKWLTECAKRNLESGANLHSLGTVEQRFHALEESLQCIYAIKREIIRIVNIKDKRGIIRIVNIKDKPKLIPTDGL